MKTIKIFLIALFVGNFLLACEKEGPIGPAGPKGEQGIAGPRGAKGDKGATGSQGPKGDKGATGAKGPKGDKGEPGTANVRYSSWLKLTFTFNSPNNVYWANINAPLITSDILNKGEVAVYMKSYDGGVYKLSGVRSNVLYSMQYYLVVGKILIRYNNPNNPPHSDTRFRYVIIPGGVHIPNIIIVNGVEKKVDLNDYHEVAKALNLPD